MRALGAEANDANDWVILLRPDGVVEAASGGAPVTWLGHAIDSIAGIPEGVRGAALRLLAQSPSASFFRRERVGTESAVVEILIIEALPIRRAHTRVDELIMRTMDVFVSQARSMSTELTVERANNVPISLFIGGEKIAWALSTLVGSALRHAQNDERASHVAVRVCWENAAEELVVSVSDSGPGIPEHRAKWLFERDPITGKSAGLALRMVKDIVTWHRGSVHVKSAIDCGTIFTVRLPRVSG